MLPGNTLSRLSICLSHTVNTSNRIDTKTDHATRNRPPIPLTNRPCLPFIPLPLDGCRGNYEALRADEHKLPDDLAREREAIGNSRATTLTPETGLSRRVTRDAKSLSVS